MQLWFSGDKQTDRNTHRQTDKQTKLQAKQRLTHFRDYRNVFHAYLFLFMLMFTVDKCVS